MSKVKISYKYVKIHCENQGILLQDIANHLNITTATLRNYLSGETRIPEESMVKIAEFTRGDILELFQENPLVKFIRLKLKKIKINLEEI